MPLPRVRFQCTRCIPGDRRDDPVWYGTTRGFFLTAASWAMNVTSTQRQANRADCCYSYRLAIVHFWALDLHLIWAGPHHLHYTALPDWAQSRHCDVTDSAGAQLGGI